MPSSQKNFHSLITHEQLDQVIEAISDGRYSWACVLILRFVGYNPLHFIPQRTYSRLIKEQSQFTDTKSELENAVNTSINLTGSQEKTQNLDLDNAKSLDTPIKKQENIQGVNLPFYLKSNMAKLYPSKGKELQN
ncbi:HetP family heterocyst commitment protein [Nostoc sp. PCC 7107]|uniref:HetP family heterocyst commitment protein n=1 Tax=Nostoc sp. PCC 7107 TaxID=317936 RepID=UPI0002F392B7